MRLVIIDYGSGNLRSVAKAFEHVAEVHPLVTSDAKILASATHIVLPGVGAFADCMTGLSSLDGMLDAIKEAVEQKHIPFLGICVGMQMMFERGFEHGEHQGLGWLKGDVVPLQQNNIAKKIPHMGWNELQVKQRNHPIMRGIEAGDHAYFVHSYHGMGDEADRIATTDYGQEVAAVVGKDNMVGTQFHPEKSQATGLAVLKNFLAM